MPKDIEFTVRQFNGVITVEYYGEPKEYKFLGMIFYKAKRKIKCFRLPYEAAKFCNDLLDNSIK